VGAAARLPVKRADMYETPLSPGTWRFCGGRGSTHDCPWDGVTFGTAASGGHMEVWRWSREHGCPWDWQNVVHWLLKAGTCR